MAKITILLLCGALVLPMASAMLALVLPTYGQTITICTPDGISTITLDASGNPVSEDSYETAPCLLSIAQLPTADHSLFWQRLARQIDKADALRPLPLRTQQGMALPPPSRAPPVV